MKYLILIAFLISWFGYGQDLMTLKMAAGTGAGGGYTPPPLSSNSNTELITGSSEAFIPDETSTFSQIGTAGPLGAVLSAQADTSNGYGEYVTRVTADNATWSRARIYLNNTHNVFANTTYEYALLYRMAQGTNGRIQIGYNDGTSGISNVDSSDLSATDWTLLTGTIAIGANFSYLYFILFANDTSGGSIGDIMEYKLSLKAQ